MVELARECNLRGVHRSEQRLVGKKHKRYQTPRHHTKSFHFSAKKPQKLIPELIYTKESRIKAHLGHAVRPSRSEVERLVKTKWGPLPESTNRKKRAKTSETTTKTRLGRMTMGWVSFGIDSDETASCSQQNRSSAIFASILRGVRGIQHTL